MSRGGRSCLALALLSGCLTAPPDGIRGDGGPPDDAKPSDADSSCGTIVKDEFLDEDLWFSNMSGSGELDLFDDHVEIRIVPEADAGFVELTSQEERPIEGTQVEATLVVDRSDAGNVSIAFDGTGSGGGYYEIAIRNGTVESYHDDGSLRLLCESDCPAYDQQLHQRFRFRALQGRVFYESWDGQQWKELVPSELGNPLDFTVSLKAFGAEGKGVIDALLSGLAWQECGE